MVVCLLVPISGFKMRAREHTKKIGAKRLHQCVCEKSALRMMRVFLSFASFVSSSNCSHYNNNGH